MCTSIHIVIKKNFMFKNSQVNKYLYIANTTFFAEWPSSFSLSRTENINEDVVLVKTVF